MDTYDTHSPENPINTNEIEVELSEFERLQEDYFDLCQRYKKRTEMIQFCYDAMKDGNNQLIINKLKSML